VIDSCPVVCVESNLRTDTRIKQCLCLLINRNTVVCFYSYLDTYDNDQGRCYGNSKRLLVGKVGTFLFHHDREGSVGNEEEQEWGAQPLQRAQEKLAFVEKKVLLAGFVKARVAKAVLVIDVL